SIPSVSHTSREGIFLYLSSCSLNWRQKNIPPKFLPSFRRNLNRQSFRSVESLPYPLLSKTKFSPEMPHAVESKYQQEVEAAANALTPEKPIEAISPVFPFGSPKNVSALSGTQYTTAQDLIQQVAYTLSDKL